MQLSPWISGGAAPMRPRVSQTWVQETLLPHGVESMNACHLRGHGGARSNRVARHAAMMLQGLMGPSP
eukprot:3438467-Pyramimonas_sp.AAC.1